MLVLEIAKDSGGLRVCELALDAKIGDLQQQIFHEFNEKHSDYIIFSVFSLKKLNFLVTKLGNDLGSRRALIGLADGYLTSNS